MLHSLNVCGDSLYQGSLFIKWSIPLGGGLRASELRCRLATPICEGACTSRARQLSSEVRRQRVLMRCEVNEGSHRLCSKRRGGVTCEMRVTRDLSCVTLA